MKFILGTHEPSWLAYAPFSLFVSHRRLVRRVAFPRAVSPWYLDSGGFSELSLYGEWRTSPFQYVRAVRQYQDEIGNLVWAASQDWMCEPFMLAKTGKDIETHQRLTVFSYLHLTDLAPDLPWLPVLQGYTVDDYLRCLDMYKGNGVEVSRFGVGSVCRRQGSREAGEIFERLAREGLQLHGFGVKTLGLAEYGASLESSDSMAWSYDARRLGVSWCGEMHQNCANCYAYAVAWRARLLGGIHGNV